MSVIPSTPSHRLSLYRYLLRFTQKLTRNKDETIQSIKQQFRNNKTVTDTEQLQQLYNSCYSHISFCRINIPRHHYPTIPKFLSEPQRAQVTYVLEDGSKLN